MLGALIIVFREVIEAGLIVGIVLAATRGVEGRGTMVSYCVAAGVVGSGIVAIFAGAISQLFEGAGQEILNAAILGAAVVMLMWHNAWMARHGREIAAAMRAVGAAVSTGSRPPAALAIVVGLAVLREGSEVVLFLYGVGVRDVANGCIRGRHLRHRRWSGLYGPHLLWAAGDSDPVCLLRDKLADRAACRRHGGTVGAVPQCRRSPSGA
jgi:FTR1 family protein